MQVCDNYVRSELEENTLNNLDLILSALNIEYHENGTRFFFPCPIHGSDNYNSMSIYKSTGICICFTMQCMKKLQGAGIFDLVGAVLKGDRTTGRDFCKSVLEGVSPEVESREVKTKTLDYRVKEIDRSLIIPYVNPNIEFYLRRGYSKEILQKYDIFICKKKGNSMYGRITIPIYNDAHTHAIGFMGRSLNPKCSKCGKFHPPWTTCPETAYEHIKGEKWLNSRGLPRNKLLFNYWYAKDEIKKSGYVILVESPGNVMKIVQAGYNCVLGIFGTALSKNQIAKLDELGISKVYLGLDRDKAGQEASMLIRGQLNRYECIDLVPPLNDYGDMSTDEIQSFMATNSICI